MLVDAVEPPCDPADSGFDEARTKPRILVEDSTSHQGSHRSHLLERVCERMHEKQVVARLAGSHRIRRSARACMEADRQVVMLRSLEDGFEPRVIEVVLVDVRGEDDADQPRLFHDSCELFHRKLRMAHRYHRHSLQAIGVYLTVT